MHQHLVKVNIRLCILFAPNGNNKVITHKLHIVYMVLMQILLCQHQLLMNLIFIFLGKQFYWINKILFVNVVVKLLKKIRATNLGVQIQTIHSYNFQSSMEKHFISCPLDSFVIIYSEILPQNLAILTETQMISYFFVFSPEMISSHIQTVCALMMTQLYE